MSWSYYIRVSGLTVSTVNDRLSKLSPDLPPELEVTTSYDCTEACVDVCLKPKDGEKLSLDDKKVSALSANIEELIGGEDHIFHSDTQDGASADHIMLSSQVHNTLAKAVFDLLSSQTLTVSTAESLTGGLVSSSLTDVPGMSAHLLGGAVTYTVDSKCAIGVPRETIDAHGVVSAETAVAMAAAARKFFGTDIGIGTTGVAGPSTHGDQEVGTVFVAVVGPNGTMVEKDIEVCKERAEVRKETKAAAAAAALNLLRKYLRAKGQGC